MHNRTRIVVALAAALALSALPVRLPPRARAESASPARTAPSGQLRIYMIDVGQGDAALIVFTDGRTMLIDAGERETAQAVTGLLDRLGVRTLDFAVATHNHPDHVGGFSRLVSGGYIGPSTKAFSWSDREWDGVPWRRVRPGDVLFDAGGATVTCWAIGSRVVGGAYVPPGGNINARSMVLNVKYGGFDYLAGADLTGSGDHPNVEDPVGDALAGAGVRVDVYKVHHHGSRYSSNLYFLRRIMPEFAMISAGEGNPFGHPTRAALDRLNDPSVRVRRIFQTEQGRSEPAPNVTVAHGQIVVTTDGVFYTFANEGPGSTPFTFGPYPVDEFAGFWPMFRRRSS